MPTPRAFKSRMSLNSIATSLSSREDVGSSRIRTLHSVSTARAMATICCTASEQLPSCCLGRAGIPRLSSSAPAFLSISFQLTVLYSPRPMNIFSATVRFGHSVIS